MKLDVLAIGVHPDDIELSCSGTLLSLIHQGKKVGLCDLTRGELGTRGTVKIRLKEATAAQKKLGALVRDNLQMKDGFFQHDKANLIKITKVLRKYQPDIVLANAEKDRHPDHGRAAKLIADACYYSGLKQIKTNQKAWRPRSVFHYIQDHNLEPDFVVDISPYMDQKIELIQCFKSQFFHPKNKNNNSNQTPISSAGFMEFIKSKARSYGRASGFDYAEGYTMTRTLGVKNLLEVY